MRIKYTVRGLKKLQAAVAAAPARVAAENDLAMHEVVGELRDQLQHDTPIGPGRFGPHAAESYTTDVTIAAGRVRGMVDNSQPEARWLEFGTRAHPIPAKAKALRFTVNGSIVFRRTVMHPGERAEKLMAVALRMHKAAIKARFLQALQLAANSMATRGE